MAPPRTPPGPGGHCGVGRRGHGDRGYLSPPPRPLLPLLYTHREALSPDSITTATAPPRTGGRPCAFAGRGDGDLQDRAPGFGRPACGLDGGRIWVLGCQGKEELLCIWRTPGRRGAQRPHPLFSGSRPLQPRCAAEPWPCPSWKTGTWCRRWGKVPTESESASSPPAFPLALPSSVWFEPLGVVLELF